MVGRACCVAVATLALIAVPPAPGAPLERFTELVSTSPLDGGLDSADVDNFGAVASDDGRRVFFLTPEPLSADDLDGEVDIYERFGGATVLTSGLGSGGSSFDDPDIQALTPDGGMLFFETDEQLTAADADADRDVYRRTAAGIELISVGPLAGGIDSENVNFELFAAAGNMVFFTTSEPLTAADPDTFSDVYRADLTGASPVVTLMSTGTLDGGAGSAGVAFGDVSADGSVLFFSTTEPLEAQDNDTHEDIYRRTGASTVVISHPPPFAGAPDSAGVGHFTGAGADSAGASMEFFTSEPLSAGDSDLTRDVYRGSVSGVVLVSDGPQAGDPDSADANPAAAPIEGIHFFRTSEPLTASDTDTHIDVYRRDGSTTTLVSTGPNDGGPDSQSVGLGLWTSSDGARTFFRTAEPLVAEDGDLHDDVYERAGGTTSLASAGPLAGGPDSAAASASAVSSDGSRVFFRTTEPLTTDDTDTQADIYERAGNETTLMSAGPDAGGADSADANFDAITPDGAWLFFDTMESLLPADPDLNVDVYARRPPDPPTPPAAPAPAPDLTDPRVTRLRVLARRFHFASRLARISRAPVGTRISFRLSEPARVRLTFQRAGAGRRVGRRCRRATSRLRSRPPCRRYVRVRGALERQAKAGPNRLRFYGRLDRRRRLRPGLHRLALVATDTAGNRSLPRRAAFTLLAPRPRR